MNFADTNWLVAVYFSSTEPKQKNRSKIAEKFMRKHGGRLALSPVVLLEARNVFSHESESSVPDEWLELQADFDGKIYVDPMNWSELRRETESIFARYSWKEKIGTFDSAIVASAKLSGATRFLCFDSLAAALASAEGIEVFPPLNEDGRKFLRRLKS